MYFKFDFTVSDFGLMMNLWLLKVLWLSEQGSGVIYVDRIIDTHKKARL